MGDVTDSLPAWLPYPAPTEPPTPNQRRVLSAYCAELGIDETVAAFSFMTFVEATRWWNSGAPELDKAPTAGSEALASYQAAVAAGVDEVDPEYRVMMTRDDRRERLDRAMPNPTRPGWRAPRSKHAPTVEGEGTCRILTT